MDKSRKISDLSASLRGTGFEPPQAAAMLSLMLLWSQFPPTELKGLPEFKDTSAEYVLRASIRVENILCPEVTNELGDIWNEQRPHDVEILRRAIIGAFDAGVSVDEIAETILEYSTPELIDVEEAQQQLACSARRQEWHSYSLRIPLLPASGLDAVEAELR